MSRDYKNYNRRYDLPSEPEEDLVGATVNDPVGPPGQPGAPASKPAKKNSPAKEKTAVSGKINVVVKGCNRLNVRSSPAVKPDNISFVALEGTRMVADAPIDAEWVHVTEVTPTKRDGYVMGEYIAEIQ